MKLRDSRLLILALCVFVFVACEQSRHGSQTAFTRKLSPLAQEICRRAERAEGWKEAEHKSGGEGRYTSWYSEGFTDGPVEVWVWYGVENTSYGFDVGGKPLCSLLDKEEYERMCEVAQTLFLRLNKAKKERERKAAGEKRQKEADEVLKKLLQPCPKMDEK